VSTAVRERDREKRAEVSKRKQVVVRREEERRGEGEKYWGKAWGGK